MANKRLYRSDKKVICGVCGGISEYFDIDPTIVRVAWALITCFSAIIVGTVAYFICAAIIPEKGSDGSVNPQTNGDENLKRANTDSSGSSTTSSDFDNYFKKD
ncbi:MAG TPA: PspC domain-containing protein [Treponema sp.]|jgi:phage shock protein PspC (stress-responsive transcriptional regulator)|nr:PspC domain-containing protein [Treponema sp.]HAK68306.1 PspC domain-containing protein [Treponema sp.]HBB42327.1 PspC domain-containing protein [Treponema sp.]HCA19395.1 PspC domain-containing protein [Treponema sp.]